MENQQIIDVIKSFEREHDQFNLTVEFGHVLVSAEDLTAVAYEGEHGIGSFLEYLQRLGWRGEFEGDLLVGVRNGKERVRLGLGGQIMWGYESFLLISELEQAYLGFIKIFFDELKRREQLLIASGHQPVTASEDIAVINTPEYVALARYAEGQGQLLEYLKSSASMTVSMQYAHSDNFQKRFQSALIIQPALATFFDNVSWVEGQVNKKTLYNLHCLKSAEDAFHHLANGLVEGFKYRDYADFIMGAPAIAGPDLSAHGEQSIEEAFADQEMSEEDVLRAFRMVRPMVAMGKDGLSICNVDSVPYPLNMAYVLLVKALLYNPDHITALEKVLEDMKEEKLVAAHAETLEKGLDAPMGEGSVFDLVKDLFFMISLTVEPAEQHYLQPLNSLLFKNVKTKDVGAKQFSSMLQAN